MCVCVCGGGYPDTKKSVCVCRLSTYKTIMCIDYSNTNTISVYVDYPNTKQSVSVCICRLSRYKTVSVCVGYPNTKQSMCIGNPNT